MADSWMNLSIAFKAKWHEFVQLTVMSILPTPSYFVKNVAGVIAPIKSPLCGLCVFLSSSASMAEIRAQQTRAYVERKKNQ